jgi:formylglycine-generating enzyme required for sulfatase activity
MRSFLVFAALLFAFPAHAWVTIDWVTVGDPGNACDTQAEGCFGAVAYIYLISKHETTNAQYAEFLNAVAATDTYGLYHTEMGSGYGGITRSGSSGSYTYSVITEPEDRGDMPVNWVSFYDALRFANWLHNGQLSGAQDSTTTEDGAYTFSGATSVGARNAGATIFLTSEDEWYKAAYYDALSTSYFDYPAGSDVQTTCAMPGATANTANCDYVVYDLTNVGSYTGAASPNGSFDQGGNVMEWTEAILPSEPPSRGLRGGGFAFWYPWFLAAAGRPGYHPTVEVTDVGFRVAMIPEPPMEIDIKPGSCPNSWNRESNGVLPVAVLGTEDFDVTQIDLSSVTISRADGAGSSVGPNEGPPGPHSVFEDVGTPFEGEVCDCHEAEGDGILDLSMKFKTQDVADLLLVDDPNGALVPLVVSGTLLDGTEFTTRSDCVRLVPPGSPPNQVTVKSIPGSWIDATPLDNQLDGGGFGSFQRTYPHTTVLTLTAPPGHNGIAFVGWKVDGGELVEERAITLVVNNAEHVAKAVFKLVISCGLGFELALLVPPLMWLHGRRRRTAA